MLGPKLKPGVDVSGLRPEMVLAVLVARAYHPTGAITVTSVVDGKHKVGSKHYVGQAVDLRIFDISISQAREWVEAIAISLGKQYDVILESDHVHIEFDPK